MRTRFELVLAATRDPASLRAAGEEALREIERVEADLSAYRTESGLSQINARAAREPVRVDARLFAFLKQSLELGARTHGAFDLALGSLAHCWKLTAMTQERQAPDGPGNTLTPPSATEIAAALACCDARKHLILNEAQFTVQLARPGVRLDPGAIGKGYALERAAHILRGNGITSALLHGGTSSIVALGSGPDQKAWKIALRDPLNPAGVLGTVELCDTSFSVSAIYGKAFEHAGQRFGHVLDPRSGQPVQTQVLAAVVHPSALHSDALSTALLVLGKAGWPQLTQNFPEADWLLAHNGPAEKLMLDTAGAHPTCFKLYQGPGAATTEL